MPTRRRNRRIPDSRANWSQQDTIRLLAWLDHSLGHRNVEFDSTIVDHLRVSCDKEFTMKQAKAKLYALWKYCASDDAKDPAEIYREGSSCLVGLTDEEKDAVVATSLDLAQAVAIIPLRSGRYVVRSTSSPRTQGSDTGSSKGPRKLVTPRKEKYNTLQPQRSECNDQKSGELEDLLSAREVSMLSKSIHVV